MGRRICEGVFLFVGGEYRGQGCVEYRTPIIGAIAVYPVCDGDNVALYIANDGAKAFGDVNVGKDIKKTFSA